MAGLAEAVTREVIDKLPQPAVIVKEDVLESIAEHLVLPDGGSFEQAYPQFVLSVLDRLVPPQTTYGAGLRNTSSERIDIGMTAAPFEEESIVAELPSGFKIFCDEVRWKDGGFDSTLVVSVQGVCSARALDRASKQFFEIMRALVPFFFRQEMGKSTDADDDSDTTSAVRNTVLVRLQKCLTMYFAPESTKGTFQGRRIRNAVRLLIESDRQVHDAVGLSLSFAAIEALLGEKTEGIAEELSRKAATLLVPNADNRRAAIKAIKRMYDHRSKLLHGERLIVEPHARDDVRVLAAAVLRGVLDWLHFAARFGEPDAEASKFFVDLQEASDTGRLFVGPSEDLWTIPAENWDKE